MIGISNKSFGIFKPIALGVFLAICCVCLSGGVKAYADDPTNQSTDCPQSLSNNDSTTTDTNAAVNTDTTQTSNTGNASVSSGDTGNDPLSNTPTPPSDPECSDTNSDNSDSDCSGDPSNNDPNTADVSSNASIDSCSQQTSDSGQASVENATSGGTSNSGDSDSSLNQVNEISTSDNSSNSQPATFTDNVDGNQDGNIEIDPDATTSSQSSDPTSTGNTSVNTDTNSTISNNDSLDSQTGDASVTNDGSGGTSTSGNAVALANVVNVINSMITSDQSFVGTINIYGNLYGDILLPQQLVDELLGQPTTDTTDVGSLDQVTNANINNNVDLVADSGNASVSNDGSGGTATSGNATTNLYTLNNIDSLISASNLFIVIINVSGQWYGYVLGVTPTSNVILLGSDILNNNSTQNSDEITSVDNENINNNITLTAETGNATVSNDGDGGTATSGNAEALANIYNVVNDDFNISGWFGILFINVFGNWYGSLSTYNADPPQASDPSSDTFSTYETYYIIYKTISDPEGNGGITGYWVYIPGGYQTYYTASYISPTKNIDPPIRYVADSKPSKSVDPKSHLYYWTVLVSLLPIALLVIFERWSKSRGNK